MNVFDHPRYKANPIYLIFEAYVCHVIGAMPREKYDHLQSLRLHTVFQTQATEWPAVVREKLKLSATFDTAILDLWYRNKESYAVEGGGYDSARFALNFTDEYYKQDSQIDVWPEGALDAAQRRIDAARIREKRNIL